MAQWLIPTPLRRFTGNQPSVRSNGQTVAEALTSLAAAYPELEKHLFDGGGRLRSFVRIYVGDEDIRTLDGDKTPLKQDSVVSIIPAIAGGNFMPE
jgi:molybdopterin converting factor small subunit